MHEQSMVHGDLKGVRFRDPRLHIVSDGDYEGQRPDR